MGVVELGGKLDRTGHGTDEIGRESKELHAVTILRFARFSLILRSSRVVLIKPSRQSRLHEARLGRASPCTRARQGLEGGEFWRA
jgi:hypothetical protein